MLKRMRANRLFRKGVRLVEQEDLEKALAFFERVVATTGDDAAAYANIGYCLFHLGRYEQAGAAYRRARELDPKDVEAACDLGSVFLKLNRVEDAVEVYRDAAILQPDHLPAHLGLGEAHNRLGQHALAAGAFRRALRLDPESADAHCGIGVAHLGLADYSDALESFNKTVRIEPGDPTAHEGMARAYEAVGRLREAVRARAEATRCAPFSARAQCALADTHAELGEWRAAYDAYQRALRLQPNLDAARRGVTRAHRHLRDEHETAPEAQSNTIPFPRARVVGERDEVASTPPAAPPEPPVDDLELVVQRGKECYYKGRYDDALECWGRAAALAPDDPAVQNNVAAACLELGLFEEAEAACREALRADPNYTVARATLCETYARAGNHEEAVREYETLRDIDPDIAARVSQAMRG
jgi:protein O-GlcNAc transferase